MASCVTISVPVDRDGRQLLLTYASPLTLRDVKQLRQFAAMLERIVREDVDAAETAEAPHA